ncbi:predicted protein [Naegleria gruberi]|uniref:Predicted protein n=1 Tax=Naegleria gruberi TaxID=5762 RepID=D2W1Y9_NAEGR|nr:uncharacterized protein NAEGRDRAFT_54069 [Naegleria gruberi]EFC36849.1 predicted protein [Naegleria gruberi]|eukprot:XP_002669593.1 predicted protein [Naegleria gruberi strain NEG-M]
MGCYAKENRLTDQEEIFNEGGGDDVAVMKYFDIKNSSILAATIIWQFSDEHMMFYSGESREEFQDNMPLNDFANECIPLWLPDIRKKAFKICTLKEWLDEDENNPLHSSGFQFSPSYIGSSSIEKEGTIYCASNDLFSPHQVMMKEKIKRKFVEFCACTSFGNGLDIEGIDFSMLCGKISDNSLKTEFIVPCAYNQVEETPVIVIGYPTRPSKAQILNAYEIPPKRRAFDAIFSYNYKTASIGKIKHSTNPDFMLISNATCFGMEGSAVFSIKGELIGIVMKRKKISKYNIVLSVNHPSFVIEYLSYPGNELLSMDRSLYLPLLAPYIEKHFQLLTKAIENKLLNETLKKNVKNVLDMVNMR